MASYLVNNPPTDDSREQWMEEDVCLFLQICNSINNEVLSLVKQCEFVKELMNYLDSLFSSKGNISQTFDVFKTFYQSKKQDMSLMSYFMCYKRIYEKLLFNVDAKVQ